MVQRAARHLRNRMFGSIVGAETSEPVVALTFDDGPGPATAPVLDMLARHGARATFFVLGSNAVANKRLVREIGEAGHALGNHTFGHSSLPRLGLGAIWREVHDGRRAIEDIAGVAITLMRPPFGHQDLASFLITRASGQTVICWSVSCAEWEEPSAAAIAMRITPLVQPGSIVLLHDGSDRPEDVAYSDRSLTVGAVRIVLEELRARGMRSVTVPELLRVGRPQRVMWFLRSWKR